MDETCHHSLQHLGSSRWEGESLLMNQLSMLRFNAGHNVAVAF